MNEDHQNQTETHKIEHYEGGIELIDILRVIWIRKYLIISGAVVCGLIAAIIIFNMSKIYSVDMTLRPGLLSFGYEEKNVYIDSSQNIKSLIESETFDNDILKYLNDAKMNKVPTRLNFKVTIPKGSNIIKVKYETSDIKQGIIIMNQLRQSLIETYREKALYFKNEHDVKLSILKNETDYNKTAIQSYKRNVKNFEKRIDELATETELVKNNTVNLIRERNNFLLKNPKESNILSALLYSNTIQQNLELLNIYKNEINNYKIKKEEELQKVEKSESILANELNEIKDLQFKKDNIQDIEILKPVTSSPYPIKPKILLIVILAFVIGLFIMLFLAFFFEYLGKYKKGGLIANKL